MLLIGHQRCSKNIVVQVSNLENLYHCNILEYHLLELSKMSNPMTSQIWKYMVFIYIILVWWEFVNLTVTYRVPNVNVLCTWYIHITFECTLYVNLRHDMFYYLYDILIYLSNSKFNLFWTRDICIYIYRWTSIIS